MNDIEQDTHRLADVSDAKRSAPGHVPNNTTSLQDVMARQPLIAAALRGEDPSTPATLALVVALLREDIAQARANRQTWDHIAAMLSAHAVAASPDAVRMAYRRMVARKPDLHARRHVVPARSVATEADPAPPRRPESPSPYQANVARRIR